MLASRGLIPLRMFIVLAETLNPRQFNNAVNALEKTTDVETAGLNREAVSEIERLMRKRGISRSDLARLLKVSRVTVTQMLRPTSRLSLARLERVVRALGFTAHLEIGERLTHRYREDG